MVAELRGIYTVKDIKGNGYSLDVCRNLEPLTKNHDEPDTEWDEKKEGFRVRSSPPAASVHEREPASRQRHTASIFRHVQPRRPRLHCAKMRCRPALLRLQLRTMQPYAAVRVGLGPAPVRVP